MYLEGKGVPKDSDAALYWENRAADQGDLDGAVNLGKTYLFHEDGETDYAKGIHWFQVAADHGFADGQYGLGEVYDLGRGVPADETKAAYWYGLAAKQGQVSAQLALGNLLSEKGHLQDFPQAAKWWSEAASRGDKAGQTNLGEAYMDGTGVAQDVKRGLKMLHTAADGGFEGAQVHLGLRYHNAQQVPRDLSEAYFWIAVAAESKDADPLASGRRDWLKSQLDTSQVEIVESRVSQWFTSHPGFHQDALPVSQPGAANIGRPPTRQESHVSTSSTEIGEALIILRTERQYAGGGWTPVLIVHNQTPRTLNNVGIPIRTVDDEGIVREVGSALFQSIPAHATMASTCWIDTLQGNPRVQFGPPSYQ